MNLRLFKTLATGMISLWLNTVVAQQTITISGNDIHEAMIYRNTRPGYEYTLNTNYGSYPRIAAVAWTNSGYNSYFRSLLSFNLSTIPSGSVIQSATLYLYSDPTVTGSGDANGNSQLSGSNAIYLEKVTSAWDEYTVTWNTQPATTTTDRVWVGPSLSTTENLQVDLSTLVQGWVNDPQSNYGLKMILENEVHYRSRNYASKDHSNGAIHPALAITFIPPDPDISRAYKNEIESIFQHVDRSYVGTGLLSDYGLFFTNIEKFNGVPADTNYIEYGEWQLLYTSLYSSRFNTNALLQEPKDVFDQINNAAVDNSGIIVLAGMHFNYDRFKDNALSDNLVYIANDQIYDTSNRPSSPYELREAFAMVPIRSSLSGGSYSFMYKPELFYSNTGKTISSVQADFGDGGGYRNLTADQPQAANYTSTGEKTILFHVDYSDGSYKESRTKIEVKDVSDAGARYAGLNIETFNFPLTGFQAPKEYLGETAGALVTVEYTNTAREIRRPLIVVEGFDAWDILSPDEPDENFSFDDIISGRTGGLDRTIDFTHPVSGRFYSTLSDALEGEDYDLIFIDFDEGTDYIQRNAYLVENVIEWVNSRKQPYNGGIQQNVVLGFSLGGVTARYALRDMEQNGIPTDTRLYVSFDSPHQGANVPLGFQAMVSHLNGIGYDFALPGFITIGTGLTIGNLVPDLGRAFRLLNTPAARQILRYQVNGTGSLIFNDNSNFTNFLNEYRAMGYPQLGGIRNVVIANGSECGEDQGFAPYAEFVNVNQTLYAVPWWGTLIANIFSPYTVFNNYPQIAAGFPFTTRTDIKGKFIVNALPDQTSQRIYYGELYVRKKILWTINVNITLFSKSFNSDASYLPLDNSGGGVRDIQDIANDLPIPLNLTRFSFIPTFSALDIGGGTQSITNTDLSRAYSPSSPPASPKNVVAANFFTSPTEAGTSNEVHTQITPRNGRWLFQEIEQIPAFFSCAYVCGATDISPYIAGPDAICSGSAVYTVNNPDGAIGFTWTPSTNLNYVSGQGTQTYTVSKGTNGDGFVQVVLDGDCGNSVPFVKNIDIGGETASFSITPYPTCGTTGDVIYLYAEISNVNYSWTVHGGTILDGQGTRAIDAQMTSSYMFVDCYVTGTSPDNCYSPEGGSSVSIHQCSGFSALNASPNPASSSLNVELSEPLEYTEPVQVELRNHFGVLVKNQTVQGNRFDINTSDIRNGMYILIVKYKDRVFNETVIIER